MKTSPDDIYNRSFFDSQKDQSLESARELAPLLIEWVKPQSVVDVGCGVGTWLSAFREKGVEDVVGMDGDYVNRDMLLIPASCFVPRDLRNPGVFHRRFDLVMSLETAEHLPKDSAETFIKFLTGLGDVVFFSGAIPGQARVHGVHLNEQWPDYWLDLFLKRGFRVIDCVRPRAWRNQRVCWWYAQNSLLFVKEELYGKYATHQQCEGKSVVSAVHPRLFRQYADFDEMPLRRKAWVLNKLLKSMAQRIVSRLYRH